jgi:glycosyltransferase involved in cell wall biosynthesis
MIKDLGLNENLLFTGPSSNVEELYNMADVVVLPFERPYWLEPPLVLLEAMSCGVPVVSTNVGAINELIKNGENGLLTSPNDPTDLAESISKLIGNRDFSEKVAKNACGTIVQSYSYEVIGKKLSDLYYNIVK